MSRTASGGPTATVAVTGGGGFIGSHLLRRLDAAGRRVRSLGGPVVDRQVLPPQSVETVEGILEDPGAVGRLVGGVDTVVHLAGPASVAGSFQHPLRYCRSHTEGTAAVCAAAAREGVRRLVIVSSAEVYGRPTTNPVTEGAAIAPRSPYAAAKIGAEAFATAAARTDGFELVLLRPFSVYGPGMAPWSLVGSLVQLAREGQPLLVQDPRPRRDLVHVEDVCAAIDRSMQAELPDQIAVWNVCTGIGRSVGEVAETIAAIAGVDSAGAQLERDRPVRADIPELIGDPGEARAQLGWSAAVTVEAGLRSMVQAAMVEPTVTHAGRVTHGGQRAHG